MTLPYDELNLVITEDVAIVVKYPAEQGPTGPTGVSGTAGPAGADGATILSGSGVPSSALGEDGDFYIDSDTGIFYKKAGGAWAIELEDIWTAHPTSSGTSHSDVVLNNAHRIATDNPHSVTATQTSVTDTEDYYTGTNVESILSEIGETRIISGYDRTGVYPMPSLSFTPGTRTFHVEVAIAESEFVFWSYSKKYTKTTTNNIVIPNTTGTYYIYFDGDGVLQYVEESSITGVIFYYMAITGIVYWNATVGNGIAGDERHGKLMDGMTHIYNHNTYGARYESGMDVTDRKSVV